jgi:hypothetical protein
MSIFVSMFVSMTVSMSVSVSLSVSCQFKYGVMNIYVRHDNYSINFQGQYEMAWKLKGPFYKRDDWLKCAENLDTSPFKWDLSNDTTSSQTNLTGQSR